MGRDLPPPNEIPQINVGTVGSRDQIPDSNSYEGGGNKTDYFVEQNHWFPASNPRNDHEVRAENESGNGDQVIQDALHPIDLVVPI